jgi:uncharacterized membrane protein YeaQ/YmgE (transglycosylase-associated protein family)
MHLLWSLIVGLVIGVIAKALHPGKDPGGVIVTMLIGIVGSLVAGLAGRALGVYHAGDAGPGLIASVLGAVVLLVIYRALTRRRLA